MNTTVFLAVHHGHCGTSRARSRQAPAVVRQGESLRNALVLFLSFKTAPVFLSRQAQDKRQETSKKGGCVVFTQPEKKADPMMQSTDMETGEKIHRYAKTKQKPTQPDDHRLPRQARDTSA